MSRDVKDIIQELEHDYTIRPYLTALEHIPARDAHLDEFPDWLNKSLVKLLQQDGINSLYAHQASALDAVAVGKNVVVVTPTASGKTLCYNLPVLDRIIKEPESRAIYLFPTKALSQDQLGELYRIVDALDKPISTYTYDGDTPVSARSAIRNQGNIVVTNPDMLHTGILPHHTKWHRLFQNLRYIVLDEIHIYRGVFGSHMANVIRRLKRICQFYGSRPQFICCSATIANPLELAERIVEEKFTLINNNGAPSGEKYFLFYNPPVVNRQLGIRKSLIKETANLVSKFLNHDIQTIVFARSRLTTELLTSYLKDYLDKVGQDRDLVRGYRGGYLPNLRREIEKGLKDGVIKGVVSTNALELGVDIGQLDACFIAGYPGTIASTWQQAGRAGRRTHSSVAILVASSVPLDQYIINSSDYFFKETPENAVIDPNNLSILISHIKCAAFELPFVPGEKFGSEELEDILQFLEDKGIVHFTGNKWHWMSEAYPADEVSLRSASTENFAIIDLEEGESKVIGEVDRESAPTTIFEGAIYIHEGEQYTITKLDYDDYKAYAKKVEVNYYTDAQVESHIKVLDVFDIHEQENIYHQHGEIAITTISTMYKKVKFYTHENLGYGKINLPAEDMHTTAYWLILSETFSEIAGRKMESGFTFDLAGGLLALANVIVNVIPLFVMCDPKDIRSIAQVRSPFTDLPTLYIYDNYPGGVGFSEKIFELRNKILIAARELIENCGCDEGCPSCVGPINQVGNQGKQSALLILKEAIR
ncbi:MAG TPA: DEAD/DEAH box helicase [Atribacterota bacterium]|nr:DEAD/DEAH box helicase [Atribacterota bacterium]